MSTLKRPEEVKVLAVIPARGGSRSIPRKNIADLCGHPLIHYTIREAHKAVRIDATIVSTDDEEIADVARSLGADVPFMRPKEIAGDKSRDIEFLQHALAWVEEHRGWKPDVILFLPPTSPSRTAGDIDEALAFMEQEGADSVRTMVHPHHFNPYKMWVENGEQGRAEPLFPEGRVGMPRQALPKYYMPVAMVYATRTSFIRKGQLWGDDVRISSFPLERYTDIDYPADLEEAALVMKKFNLL
jgi:CMP-N,N'-diacetyllegionaminic acid synthase